MTSMPPGLLIVWTNIPEELEYDFNDWSIGIAFRRRAANPMPLPRGFVPSTRYTCRLEPTPTVDAPAVMVAHPCVPAKNVPDLMYRPRIENNCN